MNLDYSKNKILFTTCLIDFVDSATQAKILLIEKKCSSIQSLKKYKVTVCKVQRLKIILPMFLL